MYSRLLIEFKRTHLSCARSEDLVPESGRSEFSVHLALNSRTGYELCPHPYRAAPCAVGRSGIRTHDLPLTKRMLSPLDHGVCLTMYIYIERETYVCMFTCGTISLIRAGPP